MEIANAVQIKESHLRRSLDNEGNNLYDYQVNLIIAIQWLGYPEKQWHKSIGS
jgi:hypothetical protein